MGLTILTVVFAVLSVVFAVIVRRKTGDRVPTFAALAVGLLVTSLVFAGNRFANFYNERTLVCTVTGKDRGGQDSSYRIYTKQCGTLANKDAKLRGKFNSSDVWQKIKPDHTYELRVAGARVPFFSHFPNVFEVKPVK